MSDGQGRAPAAPVKISETEEGMDSRAITRAEARPTLSYEAFGSSIYLSNDDTMSLSSAQRIVYAIDHSLPLPAEHIRPHELLNYFSFDTEPVSSGYDFSVRPDISLVSTPSLWPCEGVPWTERHATTRL
jgi:hypothetical protein